MGGSLHTNRLVLGLSLLAAAWATSAGCKKGAGSTPPDGAADGAMEAGAVVCPPVDGGPQGGEDGGTVLGVDEFGPNAPAAKTVSSLGRVNIFEVTVPSTLERADIYLQADLPSTRVTIAVQEATSRTAAFSKVMDVQIDLGTCVGWASSGPLAIPLRVGHFYAIGFDPNQGVTPFVSSDGDSLPIDGMFGRLLGSRTATSVSVPTLTWDKFLDKEYNRQRIVTAPRAVDGLDGTGADAGAEAGTGDAGAADTNRDAAGSDASDAAKG